MKNTSKIGKAPKRGRDRLSRLPEPILYHILSFLDTKSAVQTSVLSRAWRCAWKHVPVLDLNTPSFESYSSFVRFGDKLLSLRYPLNLRKVTFVDYEIVDEWGDDRLFERVIEYAFSHDVQHFAIDLEQDSSHDDNIGFSDLFGSVTNSNVKTLELSSVNLDSRAQYSGFGSLTTLNLNYSLLEVLDVVSDSNFPCLKNLVMEDCLGRPNNGKGSISGLNLVSLKLLPVPFQQFEICAPKLKFLSLHNYLSGQELSKLSLPSLEHAEIEVCGYFYKGDIGEKHLISLFQDLHNAKSLTLHSDSIKELNKFSGVLEQQPSPFTRLEYLNLQSNDVPFKVVNYFLKGSSNTEPRIKLLDKDKIGKPYYVF